MPLTLVARRGVLEEKKAEYAGVEIWRSTLEGKEVEAVVYPDLVGAGQPGDFVLMNTTAMELELGTGGQHFVIARTQLGAPVLPERVSRDEGHIMKLRYTPLQMRVLAAEEEASPYHDALRTMDRLPGTPVICLGLHSQLAPAAAGVKAANPDLRVAYVMTDSGALPLPYSRVVEQLHQADLLDVTVTAGQAFGGDLEAVNLYSALAVAVAAGKADVIIAGQGPGNVGTATPLGFGGVEQAMALNAAAALEGLPIALPRISFADPRDRHRGISHHTLTVLKRLVLADVVLPVPHLAPEQTETLLAQLQREEITRHRLRSADGRPGIDLCRRLNIPLRSMGRGFEDDPCFFLAAAAAGRVAAEILGE
ncbi:MAG: DUF3866 family protein [Armatimonadota bacterium]